jgi:hypothetical protein
MFDKSDPTINNTPTSSTTPMCVFSPSVEHTSQPSHISRNSSQASNSNIPLITRESLPKSPGLANTRNINGRVVYFQVLAFPLRMHDALKWTEDNQVGVGRKPHMRRKLALPAILCRLPADCRRCAVVSLDGGAVAFSVVVATNKTTEDLARAEDLEMIQNVQRVMGVSNPPAWYIPQKAWCVSFLYVVSIPSFIYDMLFQIPNLSSWTRSLTPLHMLCYVTYFSDETVIIIGVIVKFPTTSRKDV